MTKADWLRSGIKKWFEINYLDGDEVQDGQMLASSECLDALIEYHMNFLRSEIEKLEEKVALLEVKKEKSLKTENTHTIVFLDGYIEALTSIITRHKEELLELENGK